MNDSIRRRLSIAFSTYNKATAKARAAGDEKAVEMWKKVLGRLVKDAYRRRRESILPFPSFR